MHEWFYSEYPGRCCYKKTGRVHKLCLSESELAISLSITTASRIL